MADTEEVILFEKRDNIAIFTLNRPKAMNAVSYELAQRFEKLMIEFEQDDSLWVGVICSSHPKVFCAGADLKSISQNKAVSTEKGGFAGFVNFPREKPLIACVDGMALAGGCEIVLTCDLIVASTKSQFGVPEVKRSLVTFFFILFININTNPLKTRLLQLVDYIVYQEKCHVILH
jgi:enoyl-CoA hydratase